MKRRQTMKLRLRGNSVRLRLSRSEVQAVVEGRAVEEITRLGAGLQLSYRFEAGGDAPHAELVGTALTVRWPSAVATAWAIGDDVSLEASLPLDGDADGLRLLVEKDFACLKPRADEDESDAYPHPNAGSVEC